MAYYSDRNFSTFQGRAARLNEDASRGNRLRLPTATLVLGMIAALAIAAGALNKLPAQSPLMDELIQIEFLSAVIDR